MSELVVYQAKDGSLIVEVNITDGTVWLSMEQMTHIFKRDKSVISRHLSNIFKSKELDKIRTVAKFATVQKEGKREIKRDVEYYNLDAIISVGYRVNSKQATLFRQWATNTLKSHILDGYTINRHRIKANYEQFTKAVADIKSLLPTGSSIDGASVIELISMFADTWVSLDAYDKDQLTTTGYTKKKVTLTADKLNKALLNLKLALIDKGEATDLFGTERTRNAIEGIVGNVMQGFGEQDVYPTVEEKAAHLLYFIIKNHPFADGNKRSGAYAFIWFLQQAKILDATRITPPALTALTLLIAESDPKDKDKMVGLVCRMLSKK